MYLVGIKKDSWEWLLITNGKETFISAGDIRRCSNPPNYMTELKQQHELNRIKRLEINPSNLSRYCVDDNLILRGQADTSEKLKKIASPIAITGGLGFLIGGPIGAAVGAGLGKYFTSDHEFEEASLINVFNRSSNLCLEWEDFEVKNKQYLEAKQNQYKKKCRDAWEKFYRVRNINLLDTLKGFEFERIVSQIYAINGYKVRITPSSNDFGIDVLAYKNEKILAIQTKRYSKPVGIAAVQEVASGAPYYKANQAVVITNSTFTTNAKKLAKTLKVDLIDRAKLSVMWAKAFPKNEIPPFDMALFEKHKWGIYRELKRLEVK